MATADPFEAKPSSKMQLDPPAFLPMQRRAKEQNPLQKLLHYVFTASPKDVKAFLSKATSTREIILAQDSYCESYYSEKQKKVVEIRHWRKVSPLQAAALCGDIFLLLQLLKELLKIKDEKLPRLQQEALEQLQEIWNRRKKKKKLASNPSAKVSVEDEDNEADYNCEKETKELAEKEVKYADDAKYLAPYKILHKAYFRYICEYLKHDYTDEEKLQNIPEVIMIWEEIGELQKQLPVCALQAFCSSKDFDPTPDHPFHPYDEEPERRCLLNNGQPINLDAIGKGTKHALHRDFWDFGVVMMVAGKVDINDIGNNSGMFYKTLKTRGKELGQIIACLQLPNAAEELARLDDLKERHALHEARVSAMFKKEKTKI